MDKLVIRPVWRAEYPQVVELIRRVMLEVNIRDYEEAYLLDYVKRYGPAQLAAFADSPDCHFYVGLWEGKLAACGAVAPSEGRPGALEIRSVYVRPDLEGKGIGREMMAVLEADPAFQRAARVVVSASLTAHTFYQKLGYTYENGVKREEDHDHYWMEKFPGKGAGAEPPPPLDAAGKR
ncbi:GNAT family N-acetyltransferase [Candidatus Pseudoscillospira sp. SGI.172]|uniref:GNAT family N-acetyltransferase n=1 Tax=Candidatus Pseudoscillospira sp. SGI.172 TaxID=3420582 RepID=UPI002A790A84|nr:GNAT family N-acetyltransferase [Pseudoflavonifractor sp.]MDY3019967.1 GNAT family N-acetyltransferase [Oscillospiraceae bacterium]